MTAWLRSLLSTAVGTALRELRGTAIYVLSLPILAFMPASLLAVELGFIDRAEGVLTVAVPLQDPDGLDLQPSLEGADLVALRVADPVAALDAGLAVAAVSWTPTDRDGAWRAQLVAPTEVVAERVRGALVEAGDAALARRVASVGGDPERDAVVAELTRSDKPGRPGGRVLLAVFLAVAAFAAGLVLPRSLADDRSSGVLEARFVTRSPMALELAGRALGVASTLLLAPLILLCAFLTFPGFYTRLGLLPVHGLQLVTGVVAVCAVSMTPSVVFRSQRAAVPLSVGLLWGNTVVAVLASTGPAGWPIVGMGARAALGPQLSTVAGNVVLAVAVIAVQSWWLRGPRVLGEDR